MRYAIEEFNLRLIPITENDEDVKFEVEYENGDKFETELLVAYANDNQNKFEVIKFPCISKIRRF